MDHDRVNTRWLPHLSSEVVSETTGNYLDAYVVALEGWRRGLTVKWHVKESEKFKDIKTWYVDQPGQLFSLHSKDRSHYFFRTRGDKVTNEAVEKGMDKEITKQMLERADIPVPRGRQFTKKDSKQKILQFASSIGFPVVIKPTDGSFGRGVFSDITTEEGILHALDYLWNELGEESIIVEKHISGNDYRLYVVGDQVVGAILRIPPNIIGDGVNTIETLIESKNEERKFNPRLSNCPIKMDQETIDYMKHSGNTLSAIPKKGQIIYANNKGNVSIGGDPIDVLDELSENIKKTAVKALQSIPGLPHGAVDLIVDKDGNGTETGYVIELNPTAQIGGILFPFKGQARDVPKAIIDFYFPETKASQRIDAYFDIEKALLPLKKNAAVETEVPILTREDFHSRKYNIKGAIDDLQFHQYLRQEAINRDLMGSLKQSETDKWNMVIAGSREKMEEYKNAILDDDSRIIQITENKDHPMVKNGFEIDGAEKNLLNEIRDLNKKRMQLKHRQTRLEKEYNKMLNSTSWRITSPIRKITGLIKTTYGKLFKKD